MQKKEIDRSKKYETVNGIPVELVYNSFCDGMEYLWVASPKGSQKFVISTNKYGESTFIEVYNLVEVNPLEELSKKPVDTLVKIIDKTTFHYIFRYLSRVNVEKDMVIVYSDGATSKTHVDTDAYSAKLNSFEVVE